MFEWITSVIAQLGYFGVATLTFLENLFPPIFKTLRRSQKQYLNWASCGATYWLRAAVYTGLLNRSLRRRNDGAPKHSPE